jgi:hypothetical protein
MPPAPIPHQSEEGSSDDKGLNGTVISRVVETRRGAPPRRSTAVGNASVLPGPENKPKPRSMQRHDAVLDTSRSVMGALDRRERSDLEAHNSIGEHLVPLATFRPQRTASKAVHIERLLVTVVAPPESSAASLSPRPPHLQSDVDGGDREATEFHNPWRSYHSFFD